MSSSEQVSPGSYRRVHISRSNLKVDEAAVFVTSALLVSHGVRTDALAVVRVGGKWVWAPGDRVRYLGPDIDTARGWIKAILRGKKGLGGFLGGEPACSAGDASIVITYVFDSIYGVRLSKEFYEGSRHCFYYYKTPPVAEVPSSRDAGGQSNIVGLSGGPLSLGPAIANILVDRAEAGLPLAVARHGSLE